MNNRHDLLRIREPLRLEMRRAGDGKGTIKGYASVFGEVDSYWSVVDPGAFKDTLAEHEARRTRPAMFLSHNPEMIAGRWDRLEEDHTGLRVEGTLNRETTVGKDAYANITAGDLDGLSIGFWPISGAVRYDDAGVIHFEKVDLVEISLTAIPANRSSRVFEARGATPTLIRTRDDLIEGLRGLGLSRAAAKRVAAGGYRALAAGGTDDGNDTDSVRVDDIRALLRRSANSLSGGKGR